MRLCNATECVFPVDDGWVDHTGYAFQADDMTVVIGPFSPRDGWREKVDEALERFRLSVPAYELVERRPLDKPAPGAELVAHRVGGQLLLFELSIFWPIGETVWVFRAKGPQTTEEPCREAAESFLETYRPVEPEADP